MKRSRGATRICSGSLTLLAALTLSGGCVKPDLHVVHPKAPILLDRDQVIESGAVETAPGEWTHVGRIPVQAGDVVIRQPTGLSEPAPAE